jgi:hypothetical protein
LRATQRLSPAENVPVLRLVQNKSAGALHGNKQGAENE